MNAKHFASWSMLLALVGCASTQPVPPEQHAVKIPIATQCVSDIPTRPAECKPVDSTRQEYLRCILVNHTMDDAYIKTLQAVLEACKGEK